MNRTRKSNAVGTPSGAEDASGTWQSLSSGLFRLGSVGQGRSITLERAVSHHES
jgi:hypothetical protein